MIITANEARARMQTESYINHNLELIQTMIDNAIAVGQTYVVYNVSELVADALQPIIESKGYKVNQAFKGTLRVEW